MEHWQQTSIGEVFELVGGGTPDKKNPSYWNGNIPWASVKDIKGEYLTETKDSVTEQGVENSATSIAEKGDVILVTRISPGQSIIPQMRVAINQDLKIARSNGKTTSKFSHYLFRALSKEFVKRSSGTTVLGIRIKEAGNITFRLPPLPEQHRIVEKIEALFSELDQGVKSLQTTRQQLKVYRQAVLKHAFEGKLTEKWRTNNPDEVKDAGRLLQLLQEEKIRCYQQWLADWEKNVKRWASGNRDGKKPTKPKKPIPIETPTHGESLPLGWVRIRISDLNLKISDGPFGSNLKSSDYVSSGVQVIRLENIGWLQFKNEKRSFITSNKYRSLSKHTVSSGDIIFASFIADSTRVVVLPDDVRCAVNKADCFCVSAFGETTQNKFLAFWLATRTVYGQLEAEIHGATRPRINTTQLKQVSVPLCSPAEQNEIAQEIETRFSVIDDLEKTIDENLQKAEALRQSILKKAFAGGLVAAEEPMPAEPDSKIIPFPAPVEGIHTTDLHVGILALALRAHEASPKHLRHFHRVKAEKISHLVEAHLGIDLGRQPIRDAAGPNDYRHLRKVESRAKKTSTMHIQETDGRTDYARGRQFDALVLRVESILGERLPAVMALLTTTLAMTTEQAEIVATVYAAWNNLLLDGEQPEDERIVLAAREQWHPDKKRIKRERFFKAIEWMRNKELLPSGRGRYVHARG